MSSGIPFGLMTLNSSPVCQLNLIFNKFPWTIQPATTHRNLQSICEQIIVKYNTLSLNLSYTDLAECGFLALFCNFK